MKCALCGMEYGVSHSCPGPIPPSAESQNPLPTGFALWHYLGEAWRIIRWDDAAIRRVKDDPRALLYGIFIWAGANTIALLLILYLRVRNPRLLSPGPLLFLVIFALLYSGTLSLIQIGIVHLVAKFFCAGEGRFVQVLRPLLLASFVYVLQVIPVAGVLIAGLAFVAVMVMVFDEVHGMPQLTAFLVSAAAGVGLRILTGDIFRPPF